MVDTSGSLNTNDYNGAYYNFSWNSVGTTITWTLTRKGRYSSPTQYDSNLILTINGNNVYTESRGTHSFRDAQVTSGTLTATSLSVSMVGAIYSYSDNVSSSASWTIAAASSLSLSSSTIPFGEQVTININRISDSYTHTLTYMFGNQTGTIATNVGTSATWTPPMSLTSQIPNDKSGFGTIYCTTYNGSTNLGTSSIQFTLTTQDNDTYRPTFALNVTGSNLFNSKYLNNHSGISLSISEATAKYNSTIKSYYLVFDTSTSTTTSLAINKINKGLTSGTKTLNYSGKVTDSRGYSKTITGTITLYGYSNPTINNVSIARCTSNGTLANDGTYAKALMTYTISNTTGGNSATVHRVNINSTNYTLTSGTESVVGGGNLSTNNVYTATFTVTDTVGNTATITQTLSSEAVTIDWLQGGNGIAFGQVAQEENLVDSAWQIKAPSYKIGNTDMFTVISGNISFSSEETYTDINYPTGFSKDNCVCVAFGLRTASDRAYSFGTLSTNDADGTFAELYGAIGKTVILNADKIKLGLYYKGLSQTLSCQYKIVLVKVS